MATINGSGSGSNANRIDVQIVYTVTELSDSSGHKVTATLRTRLKSGYTSTTVDSTSSYSITINGTTTSGNCKVDYKTNGENWQTLGTASKTISHTDVKTIGISASFATGSSYISGGSASAYIDLPATFTACKAPTTITVSEKIKKQGEYVRVRWSGQKAGTNNAINGYRIYFKVGSAPTTSSGDWVRVDSSAEYCDIKLTGARGSKYYFKVMTLGTKESSSLSSAQEICTINSLPSTPSVTLNYTQVPHNGGSVKPTTLTATDSDGQVLSYYYATSLSGSKTKITAGGSISISQDTTLYFWSYDGLEYSESAKTIGITVATKPTISNITVTPDESSPEYGSDVKYRKNYVINVTSNNNYNYTYYCRRSQLDTSQSITPNNENKINIYDLINIKDTGNTSIEIGVKPSENIGYSTTNDGDITWSNPIELQSIPTPDHFDQFANNNLLAGYINKELRIKSSNNDGLTNLIIKYGDKELKAVDGSNFDQGFDYYITPTQGESMGFEITIYRDKYYKTVNITRTAIKSFPDKTIVYGMDGLDDSTIWPFSQYNSNDNSNFYVYMTNIFENETNFSQYGLSSNNPKLQLDSYQYGFEAISNINNNNGMIGFKIPKKFYFVTYQTQSLGITNFDTSYSFNINFVYTNVYGESQSFNSDQTLTLDFVESLEENGNIIIRGLVGSDTNKFLKQNETITFTIPYKTYNTLPITPSVIINGMTVIGTPVIPERSSNISEISSIITGECTVQYTQASPITSAADIEYIAQLNNTKKSFSFDGANLSVIKHTTTNFINLRITHDIDLTVSFDKFTSSSFGLWSGQNNSYKTSFLGELRIELSTDQNFSNNIQSYTLNSSYSDILEDNEYTNIISTSNGDLIWNENVPFYYVRLKLITIDNNGTSKEVTSESPVTVIYNIQPTISYRPNHLGINYKNIDTDTDVNNAIIVIGETSGRDKIVYKGTGKCELVNFTLDETSDLTVIDGGTW